MERVLLTGAAGGIGSGLRKLLKPLYPELRLSDLKKPADLRSDEPFIAADLARIEEVEKAVDGIEGIIHLGGHSVEGSWETILQANIIGCYNLFEAARRKGVKRVVFASSNHAIGFYPRTHHDRHRRHRAARLRATASARPSARRWARSMPTSTGCASCASGSATSATAPSTSGGCRSGSRPRTLAQLVRIGLEHPELRYEIFYGASHNERSWWDNSRAYDYGYRPTGRAEDHVARGHGRAGQDRPRSGRPTSSRAAPSAAPNSTAIEAASANDIAARPRMSSPRKRGSSKAMRNRWK